MAKYSTLLFIFLLLNSLLNFHASPEYSRPRPRRNIFTGLIRSKSEPEQVHISLLGKDHMRVTYITSHKHTKSIVEYGMSPGNYDKSSVTGERTSYRYFFYKSSEIHHVTIGPLDPNTTYYYKCGGSGPEFSFKTPPSTFPIEFAVVGDLGQTEWTTSTLAHVGAKDYDVLLLPGDLSYADTQQPLWDSFGRLVEPYASKRPWMVTNGNHEIEIFPIIHRFGFKAYNARWLMPYQQSGSTSNLYYSFDVAGCHIVMLGSYADFDVQSDQYTAVTPWIFALIHAPWYNSNLAHKGEGENMRKSMEELLYKARVDVVFAGHVHAYERFTRIYDNKVDPCGPIYVTIGDGGNREGLAMIFENPSPSISTFREASFGHGRLKVYNETHAHWSWHRNNETNTAMADELWIQSFASSKSCLPETTNFQEMKTNQKDEL
ncbi:hypothetical protein K7X08_015613 [Anisodus acutangulus]|uniref:Purple acid phosphatase n=1 Tax=Anisodus acutangulus TaxID=402998 RepID=A0A9Q1LDZ1_9SOLA|nr:hypothetical protein K7X08_015613 [Anisodus acutangulus]